MSDNRPTARQLEVLRVLVSLRDENWWPPSTREMCKALGLASTNCLHDHLRALEKKGLVERHRNKRTGARPTAAGLAAIVSGDVKPVDNPWAARRRVA